MKVWELIRQLQQLSQEHPSVTEWEVEGRGRVSAQRVPTTLEPDATLKILVVRT